MRAKTLLFLILLSIGGVLSAQDTIRTLIISEARFDQAHEAYCELTNMGTDTLNLKDFEFGVVGPWTSRISATDITQWFNVGTNNWFMLPDWKLAPGKSIVIANVDDWNLRMWYKDPDHYGPITKAEMWKLANIQINQPEAPSATPLDSVSPYWNVGQVWNGRTCWYVRHHVAPGDSVVVDQVGGVFDGTAADGVAEGSNKDKSYDVAGVASATANDILVRKFTVKKGNIDFATGRGTTLAESEWMPIPIFVPGGWEPNRAVLWTVGNHVNAHLDEATLVSNTISIGWNDSTLTVPWGVRHDDSIMYQFERKPGLGWHYDYAKTHLDSSFVSCRTGDIFTIYAFGDTMSVIPFKLNVLPPTNDANIVVPKKVPNAQGWYTNAGPIYEVTDKVPGMDTIRASILRGIGYATRVDTLFKYLEKAPQASWEIVWVDGQERTDLKNGDILKVTAQSGAAKQYYIKVDQYRPSHNAYLASITWPDIPADYKGFYGWIGDTVPNFVYSKYLYQVQVPFDVNGIPALVAKPQNSGATIDVTRASNLSGSVDARTITFKSTAEDDTTILQYQVQLSKQKNPADVQPWLTAEPFISQFVWQEQWANAFMEICNPGNLPMDLSKYMLCFGYFNDPATAITANTGTGNWANRYSKYIPGMRWQDQTTWSITPAIAMQDLNVNPIVQPGDVFVIGDLRGTGISGYPWWASQQCDIDFGHTPWNETVNNWTALQEWNGANYFLFKIDNDSVRTGLKPANDPNDFTLLESWGSGTGAAPVVGGLTMQQINGYERKPQYYKAKSPDFTASFGTDQETSEWIFTDRAYYDAKHVGWPNDILLVADGIGNHFMNEVTVYKSTITSTVYKYSGAYSNHETLWGVKTGTTVNDFIANLIKADPNQALTLISYAKDTVMAGTDVLLTNDTLVVRSADTLNTTKYILTVTDQGLSNDAVLTSQTLTINVTGNTGTIGGFDYGTTLKDVMDAITVPTGADYTIYDASGAYVPYMTLTPDTNYVQTQVSDQIFVSVVAEDGVTKIVYQLKPNASNSDAFVTSDVYKVDQDNAIIELIPQGTTVYGLFRYLTPAPGATFILVDKFGFERTIGNVVKDDKLVVTAADGTTTKTYYISMLDVKVNYLAYVLSSLFEVDQVNFVITVQNYFTTRPVSELVSHLVPAAGATIKIMTSSGSENTGTLNNTDVVVVTAADGVTQAQYALNVVTAVDKVTGPVAISVYPNPTSDVVNISGIETGNRISVYNMLGQQLFEKVASQNIVSISMSGHPSGVYFIQVNNNTKVLGRYKLILK